MGIWLWQWGKTCLQKQGTAWGSTSELQELHFDLSSSKCGLQPFGCKSDGCRQSIGLFAVCAPVIKINVEAKIGPHIIQEKLHGTKNKINLHQPSIAAVGTNLPVIHMRHVHVAIENGQTSHPTRTQSRRCFGHSSRWSSSALPMQALQSVPWNCPVQQPCTFLQLKISEE